MNIYCTGILYFILLVFSNLVYCQHPSAIVEYESTKKGVLIPRISDTTQVLNPALGLLIYDLSVHDFQYYDGIKWQRLNQKRTGVWTKNLDTIYYLSGQVGIGTQSPGAKLDVRGDSRINGLVIGRGHGNVETNTAIGRSALSANLMGEYNTANGYQALKTNESGRANTANGHQALKSNKSGSNNVAIGAAALWQNNSRSNLVAIGDSALFNNGVGATDVDHATQNCALGSKALFLNTIGYRNTAVGYRSLYTNTDGNNNTAVGNRALQYNLHGRSNTACGSRALNNNTTGSSNTAIGYKALHLNDDAQRNTAVGRETLYFNEGTGNTAIGYLALYSNTIGIYNVAVGYRPLYSNTTGSWNTTSGRESLFNNTTGESMTASGFQALFANTTGDDNVAIGYRSLYSNTTGSWNTTSGRESLLNSTTGSGNTAMGYKALSANTTGEHNTSIGYLSFMNGTNYSNSTAIGYNCEPNASNRVRMGNSAITSIGGSVNWSVISDARFKRRVQKDVPGLEFINMLNPVTYQMDMEAIADLNKTPMNMRLLKAEASKADIRYSGFLAQEVEQAADQINYDFSGLEKPAHHQDNYSLRYAEFVVPLVKAVQELSVENQNLKLELELKIDEISKMHSKLERKLRQIENLLMAEKEGEMNSRNLE